MDPKLQLLATKYFKLQLPCTARELKSAYRRVARACHPDNQDTGDPELFKQVQEAYETLIDKPEIISPDAQAEKTVEGIPLSELGLGFETGGTPCNECDSKGYKTVEADPVIMCTMCGGPGYLRICSGCRGTGHERTVVGGLPCRKCRGKGYLQVNTRSTYNMSSIRACPTCKGQGGFRSKTPILKHYKCGDCDGKGQHLHFNPLWPKMRVGN